MCQSIVKRQTIKKCEVCSKPITLAKKFSDCNKHLYCEECVEQYHQDNCPYCSYPEFKEILDKFRKYHEDIFIAKSYNNFSTKEIGGYGFVGKIIDVPEDEIYKWSISPQFLTFEYSGIKDPQAEL